MNEIIAKISAENKNIAVVASKFNQLITEQLVKGARDCIIAHGGIEPAVAWVPGALELPVVAKTFLNTKKYHAIICIGAVIKGDTDHDKYVATNAASGIARLAIDFDVPVTFGVLTTDTVEQALNRAGIKNGNAGYSAALAAIETLSVCDAIKKTS